MTPRLRISRCRRDHAFSLRNAGSLRARACAAATAAMLTVNGPALAQADAGSLLKQQERQQRGLPGRAPEVQPRAIRPALAEDKSLKIRLKAVRFTGATHLVPDAELRAQVSHAIGRELDFAALQALADRVTAFLRETGSFLARAYLPKQDLTEGILEIALLEGRLDGREGKGAPFAIMPSERTPLRIAQERLEAIAAAVLGPGATARQADVERAVLLINDLPRIIARARLQPGAEPDSTRVTIAVEEGPLLSGSAGLENAGNADTGRGQANLAAQANDPLGLGDQLAANLAHAKGLDLLRVAYSLPAGPFGTRVSLSASGLTYEIIRGTGLAAGLKGRAETYGLTVLHPFIRSRAANFYGSIGYSDKSLRDDSTAGNLRDKRVGETNVGVSGDLQDRFGGGGITSANLDYTAGRIDLSRNAADQAADAAGYGTEGRFDRLAYGASRLQQLPEAFSFVLNVNGQNAGRNLDSSQKFILGGPYGVRAYPVSEGIGDSGVLGNFELRYDMAGIAGIDQLQLVGFYDAGRIRLHRDPRGIAIPTATGQNVYRLSGWGVGANIGRTGSYGVRIFWARKIDDNPGRTITGLDADSRSDRSRVWLNAALWF